MVARLILERYSIQSNIAFKVIWIMPDLFLQKPSKNSESKDHLKALNKCIKLRISGSSWFAKRSQNYSKELWIQKDIYKYSRDIQKVFTRNLKRSYENPIRQYEKWNLTLNKTNIVQIIVKTSKGKETSQEILLPHKPVLIPLNLKVLT